MTSVIFNVVSYLFARACVVTYVCGLFTGSAYVRKFEYLDYLTVLMRLYYSECWTWMGCNLNALTVRLDLNLGSTVAVAIVVFQRF